MLKSRRRSYLSEKSFAAKRSAEIGVKDFDGDITVMLHIVREVDGGHSA